MNRKNKHSIEVYNVVKHFNKNLILDNISLRIERGDFFGLLGCNGSGKSTLVNIISHLIRPDSGTVYLAGVNVFTARKNALKQLGVMPQEINLNMIETPLQILKTYGLYHELSFAKRNRRIEELLEIFNIFSFRKRKILELSGGQKRAVMLARAILHNPEILILDEPTAGLDIFMREKVYAYLTELNKSGTTIVLITHHPEEIINLCMNFAILSKGRIAKQNYVNNLSHKTHNKKQNVELNYNKLKSLFFEYNTHHSGLI